MTCHDGMSCTKMLRFAWENFVAKLQYEAKQVGGLFDMNLKASEPCL